MAVTTDLSTGLPPAVPGLLPAGFVPEPIELREHVQGTYFNLRVGISVLGFALPLVVALGAKWLRGVPLQGSMSAYYHSADGVMRDEFVGVLITVGAFLYLYKGFSPSEDYALSLGGVLACCVALVPMQWQCGAVCRPVSVHGIAAVGFFLCIAYVCLFRAMDTLTLLPNQSRVARYKRAYQAYSALMILSPVGAVIANAVFQGEGKESRVVFFLEAFGVWTFAAYWLTKSLEMRESSADRLASEGRVARVKKHRRVKPDDAMVVRLS